MKQIITLLALAISVSAFAQERKILDSKSVSIGSNQAILVRTANTPDKVEVSFTVQMAKNTCDYYETIPDTCYRNENVYQTRTVCRNVTVTSPSTGPTGPRYNPPTQTRRECHTERYSNGTRQIAYSCSYTRCGRTSTIYVPETDTVKIKFKDLPNLGGTEEDTFLVVASQRSIDGVNVVYNITPMQTVAPYTVEKKGILGFDSYVIETK